MTTSGPQWPRTGGEGLEKELLNLHPDVTSITGLGKTTIKAEVAAGRLKTVRVGRRRLVPREYLVDYKELLKTEAAAG